MRRSVIALLFGLFVSQGIPAIADGGFFGRQEMEFSIPMQRAIILYNSPYETLIVQSSLDDTQGDLAWIIPVPSDPKFVRAVDPQSVSMMIEHVRPGIDDPSRDGYVPLIVASFMAILLAFILARTIRSSGPGPACAASTTFGCGWLLIVYVMAAATMRVGCAKTESAEGRELGKVGSYIGSIVKGKTGNAVIDWLSHRGYRVADRAQAALDIYAKEGWSFVALKVEKSKEASEHPVAISFASTKPLYPMRLTGVQSNPLRLELLIVGSTAYACSDLEVWRVIDSAYDWDQLSSVYPTGNPAFSFGTYLTGELSSKSMQHDYEFSPSDQGRFSAPLYPEDQRTLVYLQRVLLPAVPCVWVGLLVGFMLPGRRWRWLLIFTGVGLAIGVAYLVLSMRSARFVGATLSMPSDFDPPQLQRQTGQDRLDPVAPSRSSASQ